MCLLIFFNNRQYFFGLHNSKNNILKLMIKFIRLLLNHTGKCIRRFGGIYAYCRYFIDRKW